MACVQSLQPELFMPVAPQTHWRPAIPAVCVPLPVRTGSGASIPAHDRFALVPSNLRPHLSLNMCCSFCYPCLLRPCFASLSLSAATQHWLPDSELDRVMQTYDKDGNGLIDFEEFQNIVRRSVMGASLTDLLGCGTHRLCWFKTHVLTPPSPTRPARCTMVCCCRVS